jgi:hypothetical protein
MLPKTGAGHPPCLILGQRLPMTPQEPSKMRLCEKENTPHEAKSIVARSSTCRGVGWGRGDRAHAQARRAHRGRCGHAGHGSAGRCGCCRKCFASERRRSGAEVPGAHGEASKCFGSRRSVRQADGPGVRAACPPTTDLRRCHDADGRPPRRGGRYRSQCGCDGTATTV